MRKIQIAISSDLYIRLTWNLTGNCGQQQRLRGWSRIVVKRFQDGGRPPFWKSIYRHISVKNHRILMKFCTQQQIFNWMNVTWSKMKKLHWTDSEFDRTYCLFQLKSIKLISLFIDLLIYFSSLCQKVIKISSDYFFKIFQQSKWSYFLCHPVHVHVTQALPIRHGKPNFDRRCTCHMCMRRKSKTTYDKKWCASQWSAAIGLEMV